MARIDVLTERPIGLVDPGIFGGFAAACPEGDLRAAVRDLGATSMRWASRPDKPWCGEAEPVLCLDMAGTTLEDVLAWVEYCSGTYGVRYWSLGREMYDGRRTAAEYVVQARRWAKALRRLDPGLRLISCGRTGLDDWDRDVIDGLAPHVDLHGIHFYTGSADYWSHVLAPHYAERALSVAGALIDRARYVQQIEREIYVACDEWGIRSGVGQALADMLAAATYLNVFVRQSWTVRMAHLALTVPVGASSDGELSQGVYHPFQLMASACLQVALDTFTSSGTYAHQDPPGEPYRVADLGRFQLLDVAATADPARSRLTVSVVNRDPHRAHPTRVTLHDARASGVMTIHEVTGTGVVTVHTVKHEVSGEHVDVTLAPRSFTLLELPLALGQGRPGGNGADGSVDRRASASAGRLVISTVMRGSASQRRMPASSSTVQIIVFRPARWHCASTPAPASRWLTATQSARQARSRGRGRSSPNRVAAHRDRRTSARSRPSDRAAGTAGNRALTAATDSSSRVVTTKRPGPRRSRAISTTRSSPPVSLISRWPMAFPAISVMTSATRGTS